MNIEWNSEAYADNFSFVYQYGESVTELIDSEKGSLVADLGCGTGALTKSLKDKGYRVIGIDASEDMLRSAKKLYKDIEFIQADAAEFELKEKPDVIFSNAVFHWIDKTKQEKLISNISKNLKTGGSLVCEFGGKGCAETVHSCLEKNFIKRGLKYPRVFYFPTIGEYAPIVEKYGFKVEYAALFDRPTVQKGQDGCADWIRMFVKTPFENMEEKLKEEIINETSEELKDVLFVNGKWIIDYVRIRIKAKKIV